MGVIFEMRVKKASFTLWLSLLLRRNLTWLLRYNKHKHFKGQARHKCALSTLQSFKQNRFIL